MSTEKGGLYYIHDRIDALIEQTAIEIGLLHAKAGGPPDAVELTRARFWNANDFAALRHDKEPRER